MTISRFGRTSNVTENPPSPQAPQARVANFVAHGVATVASRPRE